MRTTASELFGYLKHPSNMYLGQIDAWGLYLLALKRRINIHENST
jgi:hypothetical protein